MPCVAKEVLIVTRVDLSALVFPDNNLSRGRETARVFATASPPFPIPAGGFRSACIARRRLLKKSRPCNHPSRRWMVAEEAAKK